MGHVLVAIFVLFLSHGDPQVHTMKVYTDGGKDSLAVCEANASALAAKLQGATSKDDPTLKIQDVQFRCVELDEASHI